MKVRRLFGQRTVHLAVLLACTLSTSVATGAPPKVRQIPVQEPEQFEPAEIPDTAAGRKLSWLIDVLNGQKIGDPAEHFAPEYLKQIDIAAITRSLEAISESQARGQGRRFQLRQVNPGSTVSYLVCVVVTEDSQAAARIELGVDPETEKIDLIEVQPLGGSTGGDPANALGLDKLKGKVSLLAIELGDPDDPQSGPRAVLEYQPDQVMAIGSTFKLWVLGALGKAVAEGDAAWDQSLAIRNEHKSLPGGAMRLESPGREFPLRVYAERMISASDNTATDHLIARLGRDRVEAFMEETHHDASLNEPLLTTRELFTLKLPPDIALRQRWLVADRARRKKLLSEGGAVASAVPSALLVNLWTRPVYIEDIEWFAGVRDLCRVMTRLHEMERQEDLEPIGQVLRVNPGLDFDADAWASVGFKGGSEPGVLSFCWLLERADGRWFVLAMIWNNPIAPVDPAVFMERAEQAIDRLAQME